jgi:hypothetical protein
MENTVHCSKRTFEVFNIEYWPSSMMKANLHYSTPNEYMIFMATDVIKLGQLKNSEQEIF